MKCILDKELRDNDKYCNRDCVTMVNDKFYKCQYFRLYKQTRKMVK